MSITFKAVKRSSMLIRWRDIPTAQRIRTTPIRLDAALEEEEAPSEWPNNPEDMIIAWHREEIRRRRTCGWRREEVRKVCNANGERLGKQLCIGKKNQMMNKYYLLNQGTTLIKKRGNRRNKGGTFLKMKGVNNPFSIKHLVEEAWVMVPKYVLCL